MENENENLNSQNQDAEVETKEEDVATDESDESTKEEEVDVEALKKEVETLKAQKDHWRKKATETKEAPKTPKAGNPKKETESVLSQSDLYTLMNNKVHEDDVSEVVDYAKLKGITIKEALSSGVVKTILREKEEQRNVALATNTGTARKSNQKVSVDEMVEKASKTGELPDNDADLAKLILARKGLLK